MRAIVVADKNRAGIGTVETPTPGAGEIRVRVKAARCQPQRSNFLPLSNFDKVGDKLKFQLTGRRFYCGLKIPN